MAYCTKTIDRNDIDTEGLPDTGLNTSSWTTGTAPPIDDLVDLNDMQIAAKNTLSGANYAYYRTAALDEITYTRNMLDWNKIRVNGFSFADVSDINLNTTILGYNFTAPFFIAPAAKAGKANDGAEQNFVKAASTAGIAYCPSISSTQTIEEIASAASEGQVMFHQEYIWSNQTRLQDELDRIKAAGFKAIFLTIDNTGIDGIRDRSLRFTSESDSTTHSATFTYKALDKLRNMTDLPIVPKGVKTAHDVKLVADLGFPAVYISNHGGRVVDLAPTAVEVLLDVHRQYPEVLDQIEIYADGGVRRATHVITLLALGVRAVGLGRSPMYANIYGEEGVTKMIEILRQELETTMALMGQSNVDDLRGNTSFINTRQIELDFFGAPLDVDTSSSPFAYASAIGTSNNSSSTSNGTSSFRF
ncbi:FMN-dependent alpha-hydroxy acid dehydrogenase [Lecanosticta acicola]|uniref:FMN-dependent alpha-hydroxy acid dehydrogenase n=1 Tax=Lecanosticta acicola TaxID=111012 RepID=A0AAI9E9U8_9PEZI|nr:FMN-dependent alpha-hydroxy acid dehydrogenase [Lecanosticta acicola]